MLDNTNVLIKSNMTLQHVVPKDIILNGQSGLVAVPVASVELNIDDDDTLVLLMSMLNNVIAATSDFGISGVNGVAARPLVLVETDIDLDSTAVVLLLFLEVTSKMQKKLSKKPVVTLATLAHGVNGVVAASLAVADKQDDIDVINARLKPKKKRRFVTTAAVLLGTTGQNGLHVPFLVEKASKSEQRAMSVPELMTMLSNGPVLLFFLKILTTLGPNGVHVHLLAKVV